MALALIKEIDSAQQFFSARRSDEPGAAQMTKNFANGLIQQINSCLSMTLPDATSLMHALKESPYDDTDLKRIEKTIDAKVMMLKPSTSATVKDQILRNWNDWCSQADHELFDDPKTPWRAKVTRLVERANSVGCSRPAEETLRWMLAFLLMKHYLDIPNAMEIHHKVHDLKQVVMCERKSFPFEHMLVFPGNPFELPEAIWSYAYTDGEPISVTMLGMKTLAEKQIAMRGNAKILRKPAEPLVKVDTRIKHEHEAPHMTGEAAQPIAGASTDMPEPGDDVEQKLYTKYKCDLWLHRAHKKGVFMHQQHEMLQQPCFTVKHEQEAAQHFATGSVQLKLESDGSLTVPSIGHSFMNPKNDGVANSKAEQRHSLLESKRNDNMQFDDFANSNAEDDSDAPVLEDEDEDDTPDSQAIKKSMDRDDSSSELDPYAKASLEAMKQRNTRKKQEAVDKKKAEALLKRPAGLKHAVLKKPAGLKHVLLGKHKVEKKCITKPTKSIDKPKCTHSRAPKILPTGWKIDKKVYDDGRSTKIYVSPDGKRFDRWSHVQAHGKVRK
jgi:hypothetical protein